MSESQLAKDAQADEVEVSGEASEDEVPQEEQPGEFDDFLANNQEERGEKRPREDDEDDDAVLEQALDEDDLNLIEDGGVRVRRDAHPKKKFKRLHKKSSKETVEPTPMDTMKALESHLFSGNDDDIYMDEEPEPGAQGQQEKPDDFDISSDEEQGFIVDSGNKPIKRGPKKGVLGLTPEQLETASSIFGSSDPSDYLLSDDDDDHEEGDRRDSAPNDDDDDLNEEQVKEKRYKLFQQTFEPSVLDEKYITPYDDGIKTQDMPERLQLRQPDRTAPDEAEILEEAEWMYSQGLMSSVVDRTDVIERISHVLKFMWQEFLEIPFITAYLKDYWYTGDIGEVTKDTQTSLTSKHLWQIYDLDDKWYHLQSRRKNTIKLFNSVLDQEEANLLSESEKDLIQHIVSVDLILCKTVEEIADYQAYFQVHYSDNSKSSTGGTNYKRPLKKDVYLIAKKAGIKDFTNAFGLTPRELADNIGSSFVRNSVKLEPPVIPEDYAMKYVCGEFPHRDDVIKAVKYMLVKEISVEPGVRKYLRGIFFQSATISTKPTEKGRNEIDSSMHPFREVKRLKDKPVTEYTNNPIQFLKIIKAQKEGLITFTISLAQQSISIIDGDLRKAFIQELPPDSTPQQRDIRSHWNLIRKEILEAVRTNLIELFTQQLKDHLLKQAEEKVYNDCAGKLERYLMAGPYKPKRPTNIRRSSGFDDELEEEDDHLVVMAATVGDPTEKRNTEIIAIDINGQLMSQLSVSFSSRTLAKDKEAVSKFVTEHNPSVIAVGAEGHSSTRLFGDMLDILKSQGLESEIHLTYVDPHIANIFSTSKYAMAEFPGQPPAVLRAISLGRRVLDPLTEFTRLCNRERELLCVELHSLQSAVNQDVLYERLERVFVNIVNFVGVNINKALKHKWISHMLSFVCGLGPRKASKLVTDISVVSARQELQPILGKNVYRNAIGFLKLSKWDIIQARANGGGETKILDITRVHPDDYEFAWKMCYDAVDEGDEEDAVEVVMRNPQKLNNIDLEYFVRILKEQANESKRYCLYDIRNELLEPYKEARPPYQDITHDELFHILAGSTPETLIEGMIVNVKVLPLRKDSSRALAQLEGFDLVGSFSFRDICRDPKDILDYISEGSVLRARIQKIEKNENRVALSVRQEEVDDRGKDPVLYQRDIYLLSDTAIEDEEKEEKQREEALNKNKKKEEDEGEGLARFPRAVVHPYFKNVDAKTAQDYLKDKEMGEIIIRPSSRSPDSLTLTWKFYKDILVHLEIREEEKPNEWSIGKKLFIDSRQFEDINEIISKYVDPIILRAQQIFSHAKFFEGSRTAIESKISELKHVNPSSIPYLFGVSYEHEGRVVLVYQPKNKIVREYVTITPKGYKFRDNVIDDPDKLISWFKKHYKDARPQPTHSSSSSSRQSYATRTPTRNYSSPGSASFGGGGGGYSSPGNSSYRAPGGFMGSNMWEGPGGIGGMGIGGDPGWNRQEPQRSSQDRGYASPRGGPSPGGWDNNMSPRRNDWDRDRGGGGGGRDNFRDDNYSDRRFDDRSGFRGRGRGGGGGRGGRGGGGRGGGGGFGGGGRSGNSDRPDDWGQNNNNPSSSNSSRLEDW